MKPLCPNCKAEGKIRFLETKEGNINIDNPKFRLLRAGGLKISGDTIIKGRTSFYCCKDCKRRWKRGSEVIMRK
jgi:hypothetical protein